MRFIFAVALFGTTLTAATEGPKVSQSGIEATVRQYILDHGEILMEAVTRHQGREQADRAAKSRDAVIAHRTALTADPSSPVLEASAPGPELTIVEFFDYRCGYCKQVSAVVQQILAGNPGVRVVMKELPVLGPESQMAARAALAAHRQSAYAAFHHALMDSAEPITSEVIGRLAKSLGLDDVRLKADMDSPAVQQTLARNRELASALQIQGTPAFVVGESVIPSALDAAAFQSLINEARGRRSAAAPPANPTQKESQQ
jgi:protein-disulfide isomerase